MRISVAISIKTSSAVCHADCNFKAGAPVLPFGYQTAALVALVPPLWHWMIDPLIIAWDQKLAHKYRWHKFDDRWDLLPAEKEAQVDFPHSLDLFVYPLDKKREWYRLPPDERQRIMKAHIEVGRRYPEITINTAYSFGIDDQEFVVSFEADEPGQFLDLVQELRGTESSAYTLRDTPIFSCVAMSVAKALDALDGAATARGAAAIA